MRLTRDRGWKTLMIRIASNTDVAKIVALMQSVPGFWRDDWRTDAVARGIAAGGNLACVWDENHEILGFVCAHDLGFRAYLSELVVAKHAQKRGIGRRLLQHVQAQLASRGCTVLVSDVWKDARRFYESLGWTPPDVVLLRKELSGGNRQQSDQSGDRTTDN
jgi:ribosomal protein S18 acetylase RimI-like enzyme